MATTKLYLDMRGKASDGKGSIVISLYHNSSQTSISTGVRFSPTEWKQKKGGTPELLERKAEIDRAIAMISFDADFKRISASVLKKRILDNINGKSKKVSSRHSIKDMFNEYLSNTDLKPKTKDLYNLTIKKILSFSGDIDIEDMDLKWLKRFDIYLSQSQKANGKSVYLRSLRAVMNYVRNNDISIPYPFSKFTIKHEETDKRCIPLEKLQELYTMPLWKSSLARYRDYFFLIFFLIGINTKDLLLAKKSQVKNGRLEYIREKTGKKYSIKIEPEALALIKKYKGNGDYLLDAMDTCKHYTSFSREINEGLQLIGYRSEEDKDIINPLIPGITTYYARHTWATMAYEIGVPMEIVSQALGHSMGNKTTLIYIKPNPQKVDEANRKVIDYFFSTLSS